MTRYNDLQAEIQSGVAITSFLGTVSLFFTGILVSQINSFNPTIRIPILFLIISTFSFIISALIYSNAAGEISRHDAKLANRYMTAGNTLSEFMGVYLFILAIPLVINSVTLDQFLRNSVAVVSLASLAWYSLSPFSMLHRELDKTKKLCFTFTICLLGITLFFSQQAEAHYFIPLACAMLLLVFISTMYFATNQTGF